MTEATTTSSSKLLDQVKHYSPKIEEAYIHWIKKLIFFRNKRRPKEMREIEINQFITHYRFLVGVHILEETVAQKDIAQGGFIPLGKLKIFQGGYYVHFNFL